MNQSSKKSSNTNEPIWHLKPSPTLLAGIVGLHALGLLSIVILPVDWLYRAMLSLLLLGSFVYQVKEHVVLSSHKAIIALALQNDKWQLILRSSQMLTANLKGDSFLGPWLILNFQTEQGAKTVIIPKDRLEPIKFHQLCIFVQKGRG